jgi:hypothetical protein
MTHDDSKLDSALQGMARAVEPPRDLWPAIAARIEAEPTRVARRPRWLLPVAGLAAALALVAASSLVTATLLGNARPGATMSARLVPVEPVAGDKTLPDVAAQVTPAAFGPGHVLDQGYLTARRQLAATLQARIEAMPPSARQKLESNLAEMHRAAREINAALAQRPGDPLLEELLLSTYQDELAVLANVNQLTSNAGNSAGAKRGVKSDAKRIDL